MKKRVVKRPLGRGSQPYHWNEAYIDEGKEI